MLLDRRHTLLAWSQRPHGVGQQRVQERLDQQQIFFATALRPGWTGFRWFLLRAFSCHSRLHLPVYSLRKSLAGDLEAAPLGVLAQLAELEFAVLVLGANPGVERDGGWGLLSG